jgi:hypothetical protein
MRHVEARFAEIGKRVAAELPLDALLVRFVTR